MIREMTPDDLDQVMEIEKEAFHEHWKREDFEYEISKNIFWNIFQTMVDTQKESNRFLCCFLFVY